MSSTADDAYVSALMGYWHAVKEAEQTIAPFFEGGADLTRAQLAVVADVVAKVRAAEDAYFLALEAAGEPVPPSVRGRSG